MQLQDVLEQCGFRDARPIRFFSNDCTRFNETIWATSKFNTNALTPNLYCSGPARPGAKAPLLTRWHEGQVLICRIGMLDTLLEHDIEAGASLIILNLHMVQILTTAITEVHR